MQPGTQGFSYALGRVTQEEKIAAGATHADEVEVQCCTEPDGPLVRQRMTSVDSNSQPVYRVRMKYEPRGIGVSREDANIGFTRQYHGGDHFASPFVDVRVNVRIENQEPPKRRSHEAVECAAVGHDSHMALQTSIEAAYVAVHALDAFEELPHMRQ